MLTANSSIRFVETVDGAAMNLEGAPLKLKEESRPIWLAAQRPSRCN
ncbi:hypothetical protein [Rhizobium terrae]|nr:hypothetical protein [Rhizobium terrae]